MMWGSVPAAGTVLRTLYNVGVRKSKKGEEKPDVTEQKQNKLKK